jgi:hypothetical protein
MIFKSLQEMADEMRKNALLVRWLFNDTQKRQYQNLHLCHV